MQQFSGPRNPVQYTVLRSIVLLGIASAFVLIQGCASMAQTTIHISDMKTFDAGKTSIVIGALDEPALNGLVIDGKGYYIWGGGFDMGLASFAIQLPPGKHAITAVTNYQEGTSITTYPLKRQFETTPGHITNLGTIILTLLEQQKFVTAWIPNHQDVIDDLLLDASPDLAKHLKQDSIINTPDGYATDKKVDMMLVMNALHLTKPVAFSMKADIPASIPISVAPTTMGTVVTYTETPGGPYPLDVFRTHLTNTQFAPCARLQASIVCKATDTRWLDKGTTVSTGKVKRQLAIIDRRSGKIDFNPLPMEADEPRAIVMFGKSRILLVGQSFDLYTSVDNGTTWSSMKGLTQAGLLSYQPDIQYAYGVKKLYVLLQGKKYALATVNLASGAIENISLPEDAKGARNIVLSRNLLAVGPVWSLVAKSTIAVRPRHSSQWKMRQLPQSKCNAAWADPKSGALVVSCHGDNKKAGTHERLYSSLDMGATWSLMGK